MSNVVPATTEERIMTNQGKKYRTNKQPMTRINLSIHKGLLDQVDKAAAEDFTTRSDIIRAALLWYLRPEEQKPQRIDPKYIAETKKRRKMLAGLNQMRKDPEIDVYDS
jgi:hypothetical protein